MAANPSVSSASIIVDFESGVLLIDGFRIDKVGPLTFSRDLTADNEDGMRLNNGSISNPGNAGRSAGGWFGERNEYFDFDIPVLFESLDIKLENVNLNRGSPASSITISLLDSSMGLLSSQTVNNPAINFWQTLTFGVNDVSRVVVDFVGGSAVPNNSRLHAWVGLDNITFDANAPTSNVPEPTSLLVWSMLGIVGLKRRRHKA